MASPVFPGEAGTGLDLLHFLVSTPKNSDLPSSLSTSAPAEGEMTGLAGERPSPTCAVARELPNSGRRALDRGGGAAAAADPWRRCARWPRGGREPIARSFHAARGLSRPTPGRRPRSVERAHRGARRLRLRRRGRSGGAPHRRSGEALRWEAIRRGCSPCHDRPRRTR